jgi:hypothetical protein
LLLKITRGLKNANFTSLEKPGDRALTFRQASIMIFTSQIAAFLNTKQWAFYPMADGRHLT